MEPTITNELIARRRNEADLNKISLSNVTLSQKNSYSEVPLGSNSWDKSSSTVIAVARKTK